MHTKNNLSMIINLIGENMRHPINIREARKIAEKVKAIPDFHGIPIQDRANAFNRLEDITKTIESNLQKNFREIISSDQELARIIAEDAFKNETCDFPHLEEFLEGVA